MSTPLCLQPSTVQGLAVRRSRRVISLDRGLGRFCAAPAGLVIVLTPSPGLRPGLTSRCASGAGSARTFIPHRQECLCYKDGEYPAQAGLLIAGIAVIARNRRNRLGVLPQGWSHRALFIADEGSCGPQSKPLLAKSSLLAGDLHLRSKP